MIAWTIDAARQSAELQRVIVSTDDEEIARVSLEYGADVPFIRPVELALDDSDHVAVVEHTLDWLAEREGIEPDYVMLLQPTSPLRTAADIRACVAIARRVEAPAVVSVSAMSPHAYRLGEDGTLERALEIGESRTPLVALNGAVYLNRVASLRAEREFVPSQSVGYMMPSERSVDVDTEWDFFLADAALRRRSA
jgi:CMP-N,N'-diacetyllegionaminic acid synthase